MRRLTVLVVAALAVMLVGPASVSANNDPHRFFLPAGPVPVPAEWCGFPVLVDFPVNREYGKASTLADGSSVLVVRGALFISATNQTSGKTIMINASGPGAFITSPDRTTLTGEFYGRAFLFAPNLRDLGFPSNIVVTAGPTVLTQVVGELAFSSVSGHQHVVMDVCAALQAP